MTGTGGGARPQLEACVSCGGAFPPQDGPTHPYMLSTAGCWAAFNLLLAREYSDPLLFRASHRLTVDAYALLHPGDGRDRRAIQSVWIHFIALHLVLEAGLPAAGATRLMQRLSATSAWPEPPPRPGAFAVTHADVLREAESRHADAVRDWARSSLEAWRELPGPALRLLERLG